MSIAPIFIYCIVVAVFIFGLTFHDELLKEKRKSKKGTLIVIDGGRHNLAKHKLR